MRNQRTLFSLFLGCTTLLPGSALRAEDVVVVYPGKAAGLTPKQRYVTGNVPRKIGAVRRTSRLLRVEVQPTGTTQPGAEPVGQDTGLRALVRGESIQLRAGEDSSGRRFRVTATYSVMEQEYKKIEFDATGRKIPPRKVWVDRAPKEEKLEFTAVVGLGELPTLLVAAGHEVAIKLPSQFKIAEPRRNKNSRAHLTLGSGNLIRVSGKKRGKARFQLSYLLARKKLQSDLRVEVVELDPVVTVETASGQTAMLSLDDVGAQFKLRQVAIQSFDHVSAPAIAEVTYDDVGIQIVGLSEGECEAVFTCLAEEPKKRNPKEYLTQVILKIRVGPRAQ